MTKKFNITINSEWLFNTASVEKISPIVLIVFSDTLNKKISVRLDLDKKMIIDPLPFEIKPKILNFICKLLSDERKNLSEITESGL